MTHYQLYFFDHNKQTVEIRELDAVDDASAYSSLTSFKLGEPLELWSGLRLIGRLPVRSPTQRAAV